VNDDQSKPAARKPRGDVAASVFGGGGVGYLVMRAAAALDPRQQATLQAALTALAPAVGSLFAVVWIRIAPRILAWWMLLTWKRDREGYKKLLTKCIREAQELRKTAEDADVVAEYDARIKVLEKRRVEIVTAHPPERPWEDRIEVPQP
jgi:glutamate/tyrosine decarboxylase-like PLP-dependent enzyme